MFQLAPGETALAFYTAKNPTDKPVIGVSTYNVIPFEAGQYFNKIQCFCFEEQMLNPQEEVRFCISNFVKSMYTFYAHHCSEYNSNYNVCAVYFKEIECS